MSFEKDLFISFAHIDNQPLPPDGEGWITRLHASLGPMLNMRMGGNASIWRDNKLQGNDVFGDEIVGQLAQTGVFLSIVTQRYLESEWCTREVSEFCRSAERTGGLVVENKARIFKVLKMPVDTQESLPAVMKDTIGYEFFTFEDETPYELDLAYGEKFAQEYMRKVAKLAYDIAQLLKKLRAGFDPHSAGPDERTPSKPTVYLAECSSDRRGAREKLEAELRRLGYPVVPDQRLPQDEQEYVAAVEGLLQRSSLSIHLVGESHGVVPDGVSGKSVVVLQNELSAEHASHGGLRRVIWLPDGTHSEHGPHQAFIDALHQDAGAQFGADLITGDLEDLKTSIHSTLGKIEEPEPSQPEPHVAPAGESRLIYLICTEKDRKATVPLRKFCRLQGFEVQIPIFEGDAAAIRAAHHEALTGCDAVILFYGLGDVAWKRAIGSELKKVAGSRAANPLLAAHTFLAEPATADKEDLIDLEEPDLINGLDDFAEVEMAGFVGALNQDSESP